MTPESYDTDRNIRSTRAINIVSVIIPVVIAVLLAFPNKIDLGNWTKILPHIIGTVNTLTTFALISGLIFIRRGSIASHRAAMTTAFLLGIVFLFCYVAYHLSNPANKFGGEGTARYVYLAILLTHVLLSLVVLPFVLRAMYFAITGQFARHKRVVKFAFPIWLYVSASGVIVYLMLYHLFPVN